MDTEVVKTFKQSDLCANEEQEQEKDETTHFVLEGVVVLFLFFEELCQRGGLLLERILVLTCAVQVLHVRLQLLRERFFFLEFKNE